MLNRSKRVHEKASTGTCTKIYQTVEKDAEKGIYLGGAEDLIDIKIGKVTEFLDFTQLVMHPPSQLPTLRCQSSAWWNNTLRLQSPERRSSRISILKKNWIIIRTRRRHHLLVALKIHQRYQKMIKKTRSSQARSFTHNFKMAFDSNGFYKRKIFGFSLISKRSRPRPPYRTAQVQPRTMKLAKKEI